jgi:hypothetical protein
MNFGRCAAVAQGQSEVVVLLLLLLIEQRHLLRGKGQPLPGLDFLHHGLIDEGKDSLLKASLDLRVFAGTIRSTLFRQFPFVDKLFEQLGMLAPICDAERIVVAL